MDVDALDLFAGMGGVSLGMHLLGLTDLGFELGDEECATRDAAGFLTVKADLSELDPAEFVGAEGLWDSSPCPDFSIAGNRAGESGKSGWLVREKMRWIKACKPKWIGCENVPGVEMIFREQALELQAMGYSTWAGCLSAEEYGVPQTRNRAFLMAHYDHGVTPPPPTHQAYRVGVPAQEIQSIFGTLRPWVSMAEALWGSRLCSCSPRHPAPSRPRRRGRDWKSGGSRADAQTIPFTEPAPALTAIAGGQWRLQPGKQGKVGQPEHLGNRRLYEPDEPAPTIAFGHDSAQWCWVRPSTTIAGDPRCFAPGGHHEPGEQSKDAIKLEPFEALLLQGCPGDYPVQGSRTASFRQIGNVCCPPVAAAIIGEMLGLDWRGALDDVRGGR